MRRTNHTVFPVSQYDTSSSPMPLSPWKFVLTPSRPPSDTFSRQNSPKPKTHRSSTHHSPSLEAQEAVKEFFIKHAKRMQEEYSLETGWTSHKQKNATPEDIIWHAMTKSPLLNCCSKGNRTAQILKDDYEIDVSIPPTEDIEYAGTTAIFFTAYTKIYAEKNLVERFFKQHDANRTKTFGTFGLLFPNSKWGNLSRCKRENIRLSHIIGHACNGSNGFFTRYDGTRTRATLEQVLPHVHTPLRVTPGIVEDITMEIIRIESLSRESSPETARITPLQL